MLQTIRAIVSGPPGTWRWDLYFSELKAFTFAALPEHPEFQYQYWHTLELGILGAQGAFHMQGEEYITDHSVIFTFFAS